MSEIRQFVAQGSPSWAHLTGSPWKMSTSSRSPAPNWPILGAPTENGLQFSPSTAVLCHNSPPIVSKQPQALDVLVNIICPPPLRTPHFTSSTDGQPFQTLRRPPPVFSPGYVSSPSKCFAFSAPSTNRQSSTFPSAPLRCLSYV